LSDVLLHTDLLEELAARWRAQRAPIADGLRPGLSDAEIDALTGPLDLDLPEEARVWWGWHDGVARHPSGLLVYQQMGGIGLPFFSLEEAVARYRSRRSMAVDAATHGRPGEPLSSADYWWHPSWFPITDTDWAATIACDCDVAAGAPSPVRVVHWEDYSEAGAVAASSLGEVVRWWIEALDSGRFRYDAARNAWWADRADTPLTRERSEIA